MPIYNFDVLKKDSIQRGTILFTNSKSAQITFEKSFNRKPVINLTLGAQSRSIEYRENVNKNGFTIKFKRKFTGEVDWLAIG